MRGDEADSDFVLAWPMLDSARPIVEKNSDRTMERKLKSFFAMAIEVSMERGGLCFCI